MNIPENFDRWMFDYKEGNLSGAEKEAFENFLIQNPDFEIDADAWNNSYIQNEDFVYPHADALEKDRRVAAGWYGWSAAAVLLVLIGTSVLIFNNSNSSNIEAFDHNGTISENEISPVSTDKNELIIKSNSSAQHLEEMHAINSGDVASDVINQMFGVNQTGSVQNQSGYTSSGNLNNGSTLIAQSNGTDLTGGSDVGYSDPSANIASLDQEKSKFNSDSHKSKYVGNPTGKPLEFDISKNEKFNANQWQNKLKKIYKKIERMFDYPVGLVNLQDPELMLPNTSILAFNPAFTGGMQAPRFEMNYRNQWFGNDQNSQQMTMSFDNYVYPMRGGVGIVLNAKDYGYGQFNDFNLSLTYSPKIIINSDVAFEPAVKMTIGAMNANGSKLSSGSQFELDRGRILSTPTNQILNGNRQLWYKDYGLGFVINTSWFYAGFSADNLNRHFENVYNEEGYATPTSTPVLLSGIAGFDYEGKGKKMGISPFVAYQQYGQRKELWAGFNYRLNWMTIGGSISQHKDFTAAIGMKFKSFKLVYHYDQTMSTLNDTKIGSHNIGLRINGSNKKSRR
ncbi:MAG: PorP/SprF family type IX secretion system membrane protein [Crocinitomicaceae bacterium]|nr:PorP/SprF family type IX secretion system membrane protein [Crocinitomicaceae bacterium]